MTWRIRLIDGAWALSGGDEHSGVTFIGYASKEAAIAARTRYEAAGEDWGLIAEYP